MGNKFIERIQEFNKMYGAPVPDKPVWGWALQDRLRQFEQMITKEVSEVDIIREKDKRARDYVAHADPDTEEAILNAMTDLADWLVDIVVYCLSECARHGIPAEEVFDIVMDSNASKLDADGKPIVVDGKIMKGPNYWKPEPKIRELLKERMYGHLRVKEESVAEGQGADVGGVEQSPNAGVSDYCGNIVPR